MGIGKWSYVAVGAFLLLVLAGLIGAVVVLSGPTGGRDRYLTSYDNVSGVKYGTQVYFEGFPVGQVEDIRPRRTEGRAVFEVELSVVEGWQIPEGSVARLAASGLLAAVSIDIRAGPGPAMLTPGAVIPGQAGGDALSAVGALADDMRVVLRDGVAPLLGEVNRYVEVLGLTLEAAAPDIAANLREVAAELAAAAPDMAADLGNFSESLREAGNWLGRLATEESADSLTATLTDLRRGAAGMRRLAGDLARSREELDRLLVGAQSLIGEAGGDVAGAATDLRFSLEVIAGAVETITRNLEVSSRNLAEFSRQIRQNPAVLIGGTRAAPAER